MESLSPCPGIHRDETAALETRLEGTNPEAYPPTKAGEGWAEYYSALLGIVLKLRDPTSLPLLVSAAPQPSDMDVNLASYGASVIPIVLSRLRHLQQFRVLLPDSTYLVVYMAQEAMADILGNVAMLDQQGKFEPPLKPSDYASIRQALRPLMESANSWVRLYASIGLIHAKDSRDTARIRQTFTRFLSASIPGERSAGLDKIAKAVDQAQFVPMDKVKELAQADPYYYEQKTPHGKTVNIYPVRQAALRVLKKFHEAVKN